jgi:hypothetical protein
MRSPTHLWTLRRRSGWNNDRLMLVTIEGHRLPGRSCAQPGGVTLANVHVAVQVGRDPWQPVPGDALDATWQLDVTVVASTDGVDFRGKSVHGVRGERFLYLTWGDLTPWGTFTMFRRAKLMLNRVDPAIVAAANQPGRSLTARVELTDERGLPRCARVDPPAIGWRVD